MQKILTLIISIAIIYMTFKHNIDGIKVPPVEIIDKNEDSNIEMEINLNDYIDREEINWKKISSEL